VIQKSLTRKVISDVSDEHGLPIVLWIRIDGLNELGYRTSHQVRLVNVIFVTDGGHVFFEGQRHSQASLVGMFDHIKSPFDILLR